MRCNMLDEKEKRVLHVPGLKICLADLLFCQGIASFLPSFLLKNTSLNVELSSKPSGTRFTAKLDRDLALLVT